MHKADLLKNNYRWLLWGKLISLIGLPFVIFVLPHGFVFDGPTVCIFKNLLGFNCPGCGMTRSIFLLMKGNLFSAIQLNWRALIVMPIFIAICFNQIRRILTNLPTPTPPDTQTCPAKIRPEGECR